MSLTVCLRCISEKLFSRLVCNSFMTEEEEAMENKLFDALQSAVDLAGTYRRVKPTKVGGARRAYALQRFREKRRRRSGKPYKPRYTLRQKLSASRPRANGKFQAMVSYVNPWFS